MGHSRQNRRRSAKRAASSSSALHFEHLEQRLVLALAGSLDPAFGVGGFTTTDFSERGDVAHAIAFQNDKILVAGTSAESDLYFPDYFAVARYHSNGVLDTTFGASGRVTTDFGTGNAQARSIAVDGNSSIVVGGDITDSSGTSRAAIVRYLADGALDNSFGVQGKLEGVSLAEFMDIVEVTILGGNKILAAGTSISGDFAVARFNSNGSLDNSFGGGDGVVMVSISADPTIYSDILRSMAVTQDGRIVLSGAVRNGGSYITGVARLLADGTPDTSFDSDGKLATPITSFDPQSISFVGRAVTVQSDGKILVAGTTQPASNRDVTLIRYRLDGSVDLLFRTDIAGGYDDYGFSIAVQADGKILVGGHVELYPSPYDFALLRFKSNGVLDTTFSLDGKVTTDFTGHADQSIALAVKPDGRILLAGSSNDGTNTDFALAQYLDIEVITTPGDYNRNEVVDTADYVVWRNSLGTSVPIYSAADGDGNGTVDAADYDVWRSHFGQAAPAAGTWSGAGAKGGEGNVELEMGSGEGSQIADVRLKIETSKTGAAFRRDAERSAGEVASGSGQAGIVAMAEVELSNRARGGLAKPVARAGVEYTATAGAARDAALVAWLHARGAVQEQRDDDSVSSVRVDEQAESNSTLEFTDIVFATLSRTLP